MFRRSRTFTFVIHISDINDCSPNQCQNDGVCTDLVDDYSCKCPAGFTGKNCEISKIISTVLSNFFHCSKTSSMNNTTLYSRDTTAFLGLCKIRSNFGNQEDNRDSLLRCQECEP